MQDLVQGWHMNLLTESCWTVWTNAGMRWVAQMLVGAADSCGSKLLCEISGVNKLEELV